MTELDRSAAFLDPVAKILATSSSHLARLTTFSAAHMKISQEQAGITLAAYTPADSANAPVAASFMTTHTTPIIANVANPGKPDKRLLIV